MPPSKGMVPLYPPRLGGVGLLCFDLNHLELMRRLKASRRHENAQAVLNTQATSCTNK